ncbi:hypothetical protein [Streptomyces sp. NBC_00459]|uniref:hypothetical protein n=1 Tax=Streptomyces sp. NBC_00459 TaxID=2975749 RepID=UPI002E19CE96
MALIVEIHVPLEEGPVTPEGSRPFPWIDRVDDFLVNLEEAEEHDESDEYEGVHVFFVTGAPETVLLSVASRVAAMPGVPGGVFAVVTDEEAEEIGVGRRVEL